MELKTSKRFTNPFAPLNLTPEDASELTELAEVFVTEGIRAYERFLLDENCQVDDNRWKFMYDKDDVKSYAERAGFALQPAAPMPGSGSCNRPRSLSSSTSDLPIVLVTGTIKGDLDDTIFGLKKLHFLLADRKMMEQEVAFCPKCYKEALDAKTAAVASRELLFNDVYGWNETCAYTSGTEISLFDDLN
ncbi:hypothetical protein PRNP1_015111 [Phytophthora ramorum]